MWNGMKKLKFCRFYSVQLFAACFTGAALRCGRIFENNPTSQPQRISRLPPITAKNNQWSASSEQSNWPAGFSSSKGTTSAFPQDHFFSPGPLSKINS
jgi:hypothetical protein